MEDSIYEDIKLSKEISDKRGQTWRPEDYGFILVKGDGTQRGSKWIYRNMELLRLSLNEWVLKKERGREKEKGNNGEFVDIKHVHTVWKLVIDSKDLADVYLTSGLRG